jgi:restriction system protein
MTVPDYQTIMLPLLRFVADGQPHPLRDCVEYLAEHFGLTGQERAERVSSGGLLFDNRVRWARQYLSASRLISSPERGALQITERGKHVLAESPAKLDKAFLRRFPEFLEYIEPRTKEKDQPADQMDVPQANVGIAEDSHHDEPGKLVRSFSDAAEEILEHHAGRKPMHYRALTEKALELGLVRTQGQTPEATLNAQIAADIERRSRRGEAQRFVRLGQGLVGLAKWTEGDGLAVQIERHNTRVRRELLSRLGAMPPTDFEALIGQLLVALGFQEVTVTSRSGDGGIDVRGTLVVGDVIRTRMAVQVKRWKSNVQAPIVQQVRGSLGTHDQGLIITTSSFSSGARVEAERTDAVPVALMNGEQLVTLLVENNIGVRRSSHDLIELADVAEV